jgi:tRNA threonylcarbamoyladenosine biosynthesis protein TsaB
MSIILNIETATQNCSVGLARNGRVLAIRQSDEKNIHAARVTVFSEEVCKEAGIEMNGLHAVAVSMGPGSYTGLRIGVSAAKGFCYALGIPLIAVPTLQSMALSVLLTDEKQEADLFCPMIDARRMEVYTALFDRENREVKATEALIVDEDSFIDEAQKHRIVYFGDGADKCRAVLDPKGMKFIGGIMPSALSMAIIADQKYKQTIFEDLAYFEPYYLKDFIAGTPKVKGLQ